MTMVMNSVQLPWNGRCMVRLQQGNVKHKMESHRIWKFELESHDINWFHNEEWT
jgi:hypothetical protein